jgi:hypothetical protein
LNKLHNATMAATFADQPQPPCPFQSCSSSPDSLTHLFCHCPGCLPGQQDPGASLPQMRQQATATLHSKAQSLLPTHPTLSAALHYLTLSLSTTIIIPTEDSQDIPFHPSATSWAGLFPNPLLRHFEHSQHIPTTIWPQAIRELLLITLPFCRSAWSL